MKQYVENSLKKYVDYETVRKLIRTKYSQQAEKAMQELFSQLTSQLDDFFVRLDQEKSQREMLEESLRIQQRHLVRENGRRDLESEGKSRNEKLVEMYFFRGCSQREIAEEMGLSKPRVNQILKSIDFSTVNPLNGETDFPDNLQTQTGEVIRDERDRKICEWREMGYTLKQIAKGVGLSVSRVSEVVSEKCTQMHKVETKNKKNLNSTQKIIERARKNGFHRNTQSRIERIRKVAPRLAERCEAGEMSVNAAYQEVRDTLKKVGLI